MGTEIIGRDRLTLQASDFQLMRWVGCGAYVSGGLVAEPMCRFLVHFIATSWSNLQACKISSIAEIPKLDRVWQ